MVMRRHYPLKAECGPWRWMKGTLLPPQVNRVQEERSGSLDVGELNENIEKLTKLLANINMAGPGPPDGPCEVFCLWGNWAHWPLL